MPAGRIAADSGVLRQTAAIAGPTKEKRPHRGRLPNRGMAFAELLENLEYGLRLGVSLRQHCHC